MNVANPHVSVLMAVFNGERFVAAAIESVLVQTFIDFELVIVDDGSTDGTAAIIDQFRSDIRVRTHRFVENRGLVASLNYGLAQCRGELVARLDADDTCKPTRLERQVSAFANDNALALHATAYDRVDAGGALLRVGRPPLTHASLVGAQLSGNRLCHSTVMFRRDVVAALGAYEADWFPVEDYDLWLRLCGVGKFSACASSEVVYLDNPVGISSVNGSVQELRHRLRSYVEISRHAGRHVTHESGDFATVRALSTGVRRQRRLLAQRTIDSLGLANATHEAALRLLSHRPRWRRRATVLATAPLLPAFAMIDRRRLHRKGIPPDVPRVD